MDPLEQRLRDLAQAASQFGDLPPPVATRRRGDRRRNRAVVATGLVALTASALVVMTVVRGGNLQTIAPQPASSPTSSTGSDKLGVGREYTLSAITAKNVEVTLSFAPGRAATATTSPTMESALLSTRPLFPGSQDVHLVTTRLTKGGEPSCLEAKADLLLLAACDTRVAGQNFRFSDGEQKGTLRVSSGSRHIVINESNLVRMTSDYPAEFVLKDKGKWNDPTAE